MADAASPLQRILVTGATGKQGGAVVRALVKANGDAPKFHILAVTRNTESASAKALTKLPNVELIKGDMDDCAAIFKAAGHVDGVFSVQVAIGGGASVKREEVQGKALADAAEKAGTVKLFVYSSVSRGGIEKPSGIPHFDSKWNVEVYMRAKQNFPFVILRPVAFMENNVDPSMAPVFHAYLAHKMSPENKLQYIATEDIGEFARVAFENPDEYRGKTIDLAGDALTWSEYQTVHKETLGEPPKKAFFLLPTIINLLSKEMRTMFNFFDKPGYNADIAECRRIYPATKTFKQFFEEHKAGSK